MKKRGFIGMISILMLFVVACSSENSTAEDTESNSSDSEPTHVQADPTTAAIAFIDVMLLGKENSDFDSSLTIDKESTATTIQEQMNNEFPLNDLVEAQQKEFLQKYIDAQSTQSSVSAELISITDGKAQVSVTPTVITLSSLNENIKSLKMEASGNTKMYNFEAIGTHLLTNFDRVIGDAIPTLQPPIDLYLTTIDGKWTVDLTSEENIDFVDQFYGVYGESLP